MISAQQVRVMGCRLADGGQGKYEPLGAGKEWVVRNPLVAANEEQSRAVLHVLGSQGFAISFKGPAGAGKTELVGRSGF